MVFCLSGLFGLSGLSGCATRMRHARIAGPLETHSSDGLALLASIARQARYAHVERDTMSHTGCSNWLPARPQRAMPRGVPLRYVEGLSDARTKQAGSFNILSRFIRRFRRNRKILDRNPLQNIQHGHHMFILHAGVSAKHERQLAALGGF